MEQPAWGKSLSKCFIIPQRIILAIMGCLAIVVGYTARICISVAIVVMVVKKEHSEDHSNAVCPPEPGAEHEDRPGGTYEWSEERQGLILSAFYWGYLVTHVPAGIVADMFGGKWTLVGGLTLSSICCLASPFAVREGGSLALVGVRVIMGAGQGVVYPALSVLLSQWVPKKERATLGAFTLGGGQLGTIVGNGVSGLLLDAFEWDFTFYFFGIFGLIWIVLFVFLCYSDPGSHPFIKESEKEYLMTEMGSINRKKDLPPVPWVAMFTNAAVIVLIIAQVGHDWGFYVMVTDLPKYMGDILQFSIKQNGLYTSLPYVSMWIVSILAGFLSDWMIRKDKMSITNSRKLMTTIAAVGPAVFIVAASYAECRKMLVVLLFIIAMATMGTFYAGMKLSPMDMTPNYSGTLMAISNGIGAIAGILAPYTVGLMTPNASYDEWVMVFWVAFIVLCSTCVPYIIWASGEVQDFNDPEPKKEG